MNLVHLPALTHRDTINLDHGSRSVVALDRHVGREITSADRREGRNGAKPVALSLGHVHIRVRNLNRAVRFYTGLFGLRVNEWAGRYAFLAIRDEHHSIALEEIGDWAVNAPRRAVGVAHVAFQVPDRSAFATMRKRLAEAGVPFISRNNGISWAVRFKDPDGNEIEIYVDRRRSPGGTELWRRRWHPLPHEGERAPKASAALAA